MATGQLNSSITELGGKFVLDLSVSSSSGANNNITTAAGSVFLIEIDNEANAADCYIKIVDTTQANPGDSTLNGSGTPVFTFKAPSFTKISYVIPSGLVLSSGISVFCSTSTSVGSTSDPTKPVILKMICS